MKDKEFILFNPEEDIIENRLTVTVTNDTKNYTLRRSKGAHWTTPGEKIAQIEDDGDRLKLNTLKHTLELDYDEAANIYQLLHAINNLDKNMFIPIKMIQI